MASSMVPPGVNPPSLARRSSRSDATLHPMSRLDDVDLTLHLGKKEYDRHLTAAQERLVHLRLLLGGQIGPKELGPPALRACSRAGTPPARAGPSSGWSASSTPGTCGWRSSPPPPTTRSATTSSGASGRSSRAGAAWPCWTAAGTGGCWSSGSRDSPPWSSLAAGLLRDRRHGDASLAAEGTILVKFWMHVSPEEQLRRFEKRRDDPLQVVEAHRRGLAQPREAVGVRGRRRGHAGAHRPPGRAVARRRRQTTSAGRASMSFAR